jgi:hypothetical protein
MKPHFPHWSCECGQCDSHSMHAAVISPSHNNWSVNVTGTQCGLFSVGTQFGNITEMNFVLRKL